MKNRIILALCAALPAFVSAQESYTITGTIGKIDKPAKVFLRKRIDGKLYEDSVYLNKGRFSFKGSVPYPMEAHIRLKHDDTPDDPKKGVKYDVLPFLLNNTTITISSKDSAANATVVSPLNLESKRVDAMLMPIYDRYKVLEKEYKDQPEEKKQDREYIKTLDDRAAQIHDDIIAAKMDYVKKNPDSYMALMAFNSTIPPEDFDAVAKEKEFLAMSESMRNTGLGKQVAEKIAKMKKTQEGVEAADFTQPDVNGKPVKLSDFRGKYVLLDFWASWCAPCRRENPNLVKAYEKYKPTGKFEILGVSLDKPADKAKWLKAIGDDKLTWTQVSDLKGWENEAGVLYEIKAIPMNFLIDPNGKIIAKYLRGEALDKKLQELFGM